MFIVFVFHAKKIKRTYIGFSEDVDKSLRIQNKKFGSKGVKWQVIQQEKYKSKKDALIRVKMLKKQYRIK